MDEKNLTVKIAENTRRVSVKYIRRILLTSVTGVGVNACGGDVCSQFNFLKKENALTKN